MSRRVAVATALLFVLAHPVLAASPAAESAVQAIAQIETDSTKLQAYCKLLQDMNAAGEDDAKFDAAEQKMEDLLQSFGPQFEQVLVLSKSVDSESEDGKALEAAYDKLDGKCGS